MRFRCGFSSSIRGKSSFSCGCPVIRADLGSGRSRIFALRGPDGRMLRLDANDQGISTAAKALKQGGVVCLPTETVYGAGCDAFNENAVRRVFRAKGRPLDNPLIIHVSSIENISPHLAKGGIDALRHCYLNDGTGADEDAPLLSLARKCWPGPLTLVLPRGDSIPDCVVRTGWGCHYGFYLHLEVGGSNATTVAVRVPAHPTARRLLEEAHKLGVWGVAAPSANLSGRPSPTTAQHVVNDLGKPLSDIAKTDGVPTAVLDGGACDVGLESTVFHPCFQISPQWRSLLTGCDSSVSDTLPCILRPGAVSLALIREFFPNAITYRPDHAKMQEHDLRSSTEDIDRRNEAPPPTPGLKYRHYAPQCKVVLVCPSSSNVTPCTLHDGIRKVVVDYKRQGGKVGVLRRHYSSSALGDEDQEQPDSEIIVKGDVAQYSRRLFAALRDMEDKGVEVCIVEGVEQDDTTMAEALLNRLSKCADEVLILP